MSDAVAEREAWRADPDHRRHRMYPDDPVKELCRLRGRAEKSVSGFGTFGKPDTDMMYEVIGEIMKKMKRLEFLEGKLKEMIEGSNGE